MERRNQVRHRDVEEVAGRERQHVGHRMGTWLPNSSIAMAPNTPPIADDRLSSSARDREYPAASRIAKSPASCGISCAATASAVVTPSGSDTMHGGGDDDAVDEGVDGVTQNHERDGGPVHVAFVVVVRMAPEHEFLEDEERDDAGEQRAERARRRQRLERFAAPGRAAPRRAACRRRTTPARARRVPARISLTNSSTDAVIRPPTLPTIARPIAASQIGTASSIGESSSILAAWNERRSSRGLHRESDGRRRLRLARDGFSVLAVGRDEAALAARVRGDRSRRRTRGAAGRRRDGRRRARARSSRARSARSAAWTRSSTRPA